MSGNNVSPPSDDFKSLKVSPFPEWRNDSSTGLDSESCAILVMFKQNACTVFKMDSHFFAIYLNPSFC